MVIKSPGNRVLVHSEKDMRKEEMVRMAAFEKKLGKLDLYVEK